jgi:hypothetical protein
MNDTSYVALFAVVALSVLYGLEHRWPLGPGGFSAASTHVAEGEFCWPLGSAAPGLALVVLRRHYMRLGRDDHV